MKLYLVTTRGDFQIFGGSSVLGLNSVYVLAENPTQAEDKVVNSLSDLGFPRDRAVIKIQCLAEDKEYPDLGRIIL